MTANECKHLLRDDTLTDEQVLKIRDDLYTLARIALDAWQKKQSLKQDQKHGERI